MEGTLQAIREDIKRHLAGDDPTSAEQLFKSIVALIDATIPEPEEQNER